MKRIGRWVLEAPLGDGGLATLHRGRHEETGDEVAVKILKPNADVVLTDRFRREAETIARLDHPNVVRIVDFGVEGSTPFMALELLRGDSLQAVIAREGALPTKRAATIADQILAALVRCHDHDIVHRDVKPSNVMLLEGDAVKLIDFGLARVGRDVAQKLTETGTVQGTPHYMSPEQCRGEEVGSASDIYSAGILVHEMLAGKTPFTGGDAATLMAAHLFVDPPALADIPPGLAAVVRSALAKRPEDRPSAEALRIALAGAVRGTDHVTRRLANAESRIDQLATPREQRAIGGTASAAVEAHGVAVVWLPNDARSASLASCLGTGGIAVELAFGDDIPDARGVVVLSSRERLRRLRERDRKRPIVVVDVAGPDETTEVIRLGADDMLLRDAPDADLVAKVKRLLRRVKPRLA